MMKSFLIILLLLTATDMTAQWKERFRMASDIGAVHSTESDNLGMFLHLEPQLYASEHFLVGLRMGATINAQSFSAMEDADWQIDEESDHGFFSILATLSIERQKGEFRPYAGLGLGPYLMGSYVDIDRVRVADVELENVEGTIDVQLGLLARAGLEYGKTRFGIEYNLIPESDIDVLNGQKVGIARHSYFGIALGFILLDTRH